MISTPIEGPPWQPDLFDDYKRIELSDGTPLQFWVGDENSYFTIDEQGNVFYKCDDGVLIDVTYNQDLPAQIANAATIAEDRYFQREQYA